jgi:cytoskeletal protein RodZ
MALAQNNADNSRATNTPGRELAFARERLSLSLEELSRRTKIGMPYLVAIENDDVEKLPGHFYARGFLRAYAHEVHCDAEDIVRRFGIAAEEHARNMPPIDEAFHLPPAVELDDRRIARRIQLLALAILVSGGFYVASGHPIRLPLTLRSTAAKNAASAPAAAASDSVPAAVAMSGQAAAPAAPPSTATLSIEVHSKEECWLAATADGERVIYRTLNAGETARIDARHEIVLRVGDASALSYAINGEAAKPLGEAGEAVTIRVTPNNYREYLSSRPSTEHAGGVL